MTEYICKYAPVEILAGFGERTELVNQAVERAERADCIIHKNMCGFSRALIESRMRDGGDALLLTDCCDSIRRAGDVLRAEGQKVFMLDLPHRGDCCGRQLYKNHLCRFIEKFSAASGREFDRAAFAAACGQAVPRPQGPYIAVLGARMSGELFDYVKEASPVPVRDATCTGIRAIASPPAALCLDELMDWYAGELLSQPPCMRMIDVAGRRALTDDPNLWGVVYNTVSFCDFYGFEYAAIRNQLPVPFLKVETDYTLQASAQMKNRLDAFFENMGAAAVRPRPETGGKRRYAAGIDSGSTSTNAVILDHNRKIVAFSVLPTGVSVSDSAGLALDKAMKEAGLTGRDIGCTVATGYGRSGIGLGDREITEITCHAKGAYFLNPAVRTVIDIGGQDSKVIRLEESGVVRDFAMNDKCAAGTGRFIEMMAQSLGLGLEEMTTCGLKWSEEVVISSMCSVFAQSEVVSLIASGKKLPDIVHGLNLSVAAKVLALCGRVGVERECMMTGGVAKNTGVVRAIEQMLGFPVFLPAEPQICGALGAALLAWDGER